MFKTELFSPEDKELLNGNSENVSWLLHPVVSAHLSKRFPHFVLDQTQDQLIILTSFLHTYFCNIIMS